MANKQKKRINEQTSKKLTFFTILFLLLQIFVGFGLLILKQAEAAGTIYYVDNTITDIHIASATPDCTNYDPVAFICSGGSASAYKTIADVNAGTFSSDDQILFRKGQTWHEQLIVPSSGTSGHPITFGMYGSGANPKIDGTNAITGWTQYVGISTATFITLNYTTNTATNKYCSTLAWTPNVVYQDGVPLTYKTSLGAMTAGSFWLDSTNSKLCVWTTDSTNPSTHTIEATRYPVADYGLVTIYQKSNITIDSLDLSRSNYYGVDIYQSTNVVVQNSSFEYTYHNAIQVYDTGNNISALNNTFSNGGIDRIMGGSEGVAVNFSGVLTGTIHGNTVTAEHGEGIQVNGGTQNVEISNNVLSNGQIYGIYVSAGYFNGGDTKNITVKYNKAYNNGTHQYVIALETADNIDGVQFFGNIADGGTSCSGAALLFGYTGTGIIKNVSVYNNTFYNCYYGIIAYGPTSDRSNSFKNNILVTTTGGFPWDLEDTNEVNYSPDYDLLYSIGSSNVIHWLGTSYTLEAFQSAKNKMLHSVTQTGACSPPAGRDFRQDMRNFVIGLSQYARAKSPGFVIIPQNGQELATSDGTSAGATMTGYLNAIDGQGREDLFYGYVADDIATLPSVTNLFSAVLDIEKANGKKILAIDYATTPANVSDSYAQNAAKGYISIAQVRGLNSIPAAPAPYNANGAANINTLASANNFLYLLNYSPAYPTRTDALSAIQSANFDVVVMDAFFSDKTPFTASEINSLKTKPGGGKRLVISYMSIGEAENYRFYWQPSWVVGSPCWLSAENPNWPGNYKVRYWEPAWQSYIFGNSKAYLDQILAAGFDGAYLDVVDAFEYFENSSQNCIYTLSPTTQTFTSAAGTGSVSVTASGSSCAWTATSPLNWVTITSGSGTGSGTAGFTVSANTLGAGQRTGNITIAGQTFMVTQSDTAFADVLSTNVFYNYINAIYNAHITVGCSQNPLMYCPDASVTRGQMAAFIIRAKYGETFTYTQTPYFSDVPATNVFFKYVQKMKDDAITTVTGTYGVNDVVTRGQMAAFIIRAKYGENFTYTQTPYFSDVPATNAFFKYVQKLKDTGITVVTGTYGVNDVVTRGQMAAFIARAFLNMP